ncbi:MAG: VWA domain-containing protein [Elusimicrobia bacterium]|nr:VWA domain-containing protein [Elusimicrobiota bacterium]
MFREPTFLLWLAAALAGGVAALAWSALRRRALATALGAPGTLSRLVPPEAAGRRRLKAGLQLAGLGLLFLALAGPQWGVELVATQGASRQVMIAVDTSLSMLTEDVKPNRIEKAKQELSLLLDSLRGERVGVIAFAGEPAVVCPLTTDIDAAKQLLRSIEAGMIAVPGTGIGKAIRLAASSLSRYPGTKTLVLLSDGEDHKTDPAGAAEEAAAAEVKIYAVGIGTSEGAPIPIKDASGALAGYKKDKKGATVVSKLMEATLTEVASKTQGEYFRLSPNQNEAGDIVERIQKSDKAEGVGGTANSFKNRFIFPLSFAFILLLLEMVIPEKGPFRPFRAKRDARQTERLTRAAVAAAFFVFVGEGGVHAATAEGSLRKGNRLYEREQYVPALEAYAASGKKNPQDPRPVFNAGDALYRLEELDKAATAFEAIGKSNYPAPLRAAAYYNMGNARLQAGEFPKAIDAYRQSLRIDPSDRDAIHNLAVALYYLKHPPPPKKNKPKDEPKPPQKPQDKKDKGGGQDKPEDGKGGSPPPQAKTRPQDQISGEDAQRIMRAVAEKEKTAGAQARQLQKQPAKKPEVEEDW